MTKLLQQAWLQRGWLAWLLRPLSIVYSGLVGLRKHLYQSGRLKSEHPGVPTVVVGNVVAGGGGKTPLVIALTRHWQGQGLKVGVVSRGHGRSRLDCQEVLALTLAAEAGDEAILIKQKTAAPVFVAARRIEAARALLRAYPETQVLLCDDGLQHLALQRDIEITVFDNRGLGNGWPLPAGPLRERWARQAVNGEGFVLHTGNAPAFAGFVSSRKLADSAIDAHGCKVSLDSLKGLELVALAGIATPEAFFDMLEQAGLHLAKKVALPDHFDFSGYTLPATHLPRQAPVTLLCTEKDAVKLFTLPIAKSARVLSVPLEFLPEDDFLLALDKQLAPLISHLPLQHGHKIA